MKLRICSLFILTVLLAGCGGTGSTTKTKKPRVNRSIITYEEIQTINVTNAYEIVKRLRPDLLNKDQKQMPNLSDGGVTDFNFAVLIYLNGSRFGEKTSLRNIEYNRVKEIRYYDPDESVFKFGSNARGGVFDVITVDIQ
jgi:hypothetical protein